MHLFASSNLHILFVVAVLQFFLKAMKKSSNNSYFTGIKYTENCVELSIFFSSVEYLDFSS